MEAKKTTITTDIIISTLKELKEQDIELMEPVIIVAYNLSVKKWEMCMKPLTLNIVEIYASYYTDPIDTFNYKWTSPIYLFNNIPEAQRVLDIITLGDPSEEDV